MRTSFGKNLGKFLMVAFLVTTFGMPKQGNAAAKNNTATKENAAAKNGAGADNAPINPNAVVAKVFKELIKESDISKALSAIPAEITKNLTTKQLRAAVLKNLIRQALLTSEAKLAHMDKDASVKKDMQAAADAVASQAYMRKILQSRVTSAAIEQYYQKFAAQLKGQKEYKVGLIVCKDEDTAKKALSEMAKGTDFKVVASKYSGLPDQVKERAAEGMFIIKMMLPPEVQKAVDSMKNNDYTKTAIKTTSGMYIVKLFDTRPMKVPTLQELAGHIRGLLMQEQTEKFLSDLEKKANVVIYDEEYKKEMEAQEKAINSARQQAAAAAAA